MSIPCIFVSTVVVSLCDCATTNCPEEFKVKCLKTLSSPDLTYDSNVSLSIYVSHSSEPSDFCFLTFIAPLKSFSPVLPRLKLCVTNCAFINAFKYSFWFSLDI